jgi:hypothetical protein
MGRCNKCILRELRASAKRTGAKVVTRASTVQLWSGGVDVFVVPAGGKLDTSVDKRGNHGPQWKAWFAELSNKCAC